MYTVQILQYETVSAYGIPTDLRKFLAYEGNSTKILASSPASPIFFNARERKEGESGTRNHVRDV